MVPPDKNEIRVTLGVVVRETGLAHQTIRECGARQIVGEPFTREDIVRLRRVRRLRELGVNLQGIEIILHMRERIERLQAELDHWERSRRQTWGELASVRYLLTWDGDEEEYG